MNQTIKTHPVLQGFLENQLTRHVKHLQVTNERDLHDLQERVSVSDCCNTDYYTGGYNTVCACCGHNCELVMP